METKQKEKIDWEGVNDFVKEIFPELESNLEKKLSDINLQKGKPILLTENYPSRIELCFVATTGCFNQAEEEMERELRENQSEISKIVSDIAKKYNLNAVGGIFTKRYFKKGVYKNQLVRDIGFYTFKPKYQEFKR